MLSTEKVCGEIEKYIRHDLFLQEAYSLVEEIRFTNGNFFKKFI